MDIFKTIAPYLRARFGNTERGAALVEYALLLALIAVVCIIALTTLGDNAASKFEDISASLEPPAALRRFHDLTYPRVNARKERTSVRSFCFLLPGRP